MSELITGAAPVQKPPVPSGEGYPANWLHATIHLNPQTGEMHSDGNHSVRAYLQQHMLTNEQAVTIEAGLLLAETDLRKSARSWKRKKNATMSDQCVKEADKIAAVRAALAKAQGKEG